MQKYLKPIIAFSFIPQIILLKILAKSPEFVEHYYSNGLYQWPSKLFHILLGWIPFSVGDIGYTLLVFFAIRWLLRHRKRIITDTKHWFLDVLFALSIGYFAFHLLWAFNYYRLPLHTAMDLENDYSTEALIKLSERLVTKSNVIHRIITSDPDQMVLMPYSKSELLSLTPNGFEQLSKEYPHLSYTTSSLKRSLYSVPLTYMGFSGYLNPFTNEAHIDGLIPTYKYPTTASHEIAHQLGYAAENEANFIGALAAIKHENIYFNYSGYTFALQHCLNEVYKRDPSAYQALILKMHIGILKNYEEAREFWEAYNNPLEPFFKETYSGYLKANHQSDGIESYNYVVALLVNYYETHDL